jgi:ribosomal protein S18 acetylase RimI-like enzyme
MVFVHPAVQRRGIGVALLGGALCSARERGATDASVWTATDNRPAQRLYERVGMTAAETRQVAPATAWVRYACEL